MTGLYRVVYCSRNLLPDAAASLAAQVQDILDMSRRNYARDGISGALLFSGGCFAQALEGPQDAVEATFERIQCDERHTEVIVLAAGPIRERDFADWSMAFHGDPSARDPLLQLDLKRAVEAHTDAGGHVIDLMLSVVSRECEWLAYP